MSELLTKIPTPVIVIVGAIVVLSIFLIVYSYIKNKTMDGIRDDVYQLFLTAEHKYNESEAGKEKMKWVIQEAKKLLPGWIQVMISDDDVEKIIQLWFNGIKDLLDDGKVNGSQKTAEK